ncbi:MAG: ABC transporter substrate-binding protein [Variibacter sp.]
MAFGQAPDPECASPKEVQGFLTCADVEAAKKEGSVVLYGPAGKTREVLREFNKLFPEIRTQFVWMQTGALFAKVEQEAKTNNTLVDVVVLSDPTLLNDMQRAKTIVKYNSPELKAYSDPRMQSTPPGFWTTWGVVATSIVYNTTTIGPNPPQNWKDLIDKRFAGRRASLKDTTSGLQFAQWKTLTDLYGPEYWTKGIASLQPIAFDSFTQQFDRLVSGADIVAINGQTSGAMQFIDKGAPLKIVYPKDGIPATLEGLAVVSGAPHPQAARLMTDYLLSKKGQTAIVNIIQYFSSRPDVKPPKDSGAPSDVKFLIPDWNKAATERKTFEADWVTVLGK